MTVNLEDYYYETDRCPKCNNCKWVDFIYTRSARFAKICPSVAYYKYEAYAAHGRLHLARGLMEGRLQFTPKFMEVIYGCNLCGACDIRCKRNLDLEILLTLEGLRERAVRDGGGPMPEHKKVALNIEKEKNRYGAQHEARASWLPSNVKPAEKADTVYFVGCASSYRHHEISQATASILNAAGEKFMLMDEWCCGHPLSVVGDRESAKKMAEHNLDTLKKTGASKILASCAECYHTWKVEYPKLFKKSTEDMGYKVMHVSEMAADFLKEGRLKPAKKIDMKVSYHDSCYLARMSEPWIHWEGTHGIHGLDVPPKTYRRGTHGVYEPPREILKGIEGIELVEMERIRENAWCCGAGGGAQDAYPDFALWTAGERLEEAKTQGVEAIVSSCPYCKENLGRAIKERQDNLKVYDLTEIIAKSLSN